MTWKSMSGPRKPVTGLCPKHPAMKTQYELRVITWIDILGFGAYIQSDTSAAMVKKALDLVKEAANYKPPARKVFRQRFTNFSDTIVRTTPILRARNQINDFGLLFYEALAMVYLQSWLIDNHKLLIRGCLTIGEIVHTSSHLFGPGVVDAYNLEKEKAKFPRIILSPTLMKDYRKTEYLKSELHTNAEDFQYLRAIVRKDSDGIYFVDYLRALESQCDSADEYLQFADRHRLYVVSELEKHAIGCCVRDKIEWLKKYHNSTMKRFPTTLFATIGRRRTDFMAP